MVTSAGYPANTVENLKLNTRCSTAYFTPARTFSLLGLLMLWRTAHKSHLRWSGKMLLGTMLMGFGVFNVLEGIVDHHLLGLHHVNETVPHGQWMYWDIGFLLWGAAMLLGGRMVLKKGRWQPPGTN